MQTFCNEALTISLPDHQGTGTCSAAARQGSKFDKPIICYGRCLQDKVAEGDGSGARGVLNRAKELWAAPTTDAAARQQQRLALGQLSLAHAHSYLAASGFADPKVCWLP